MKLQSFPIVCYICIMRAKLIILDFDGTLGDTREIILRTNKELLALKGYPIPSDRDTSSLLEYGVSTALHHDGHNGIGCNEIDDIMKQYDGKVEIVSSPQNEFTVKYTLTFNRSNTIGSFKF